ncbi:hypothetical protein DYB38_004383 [Aphanomyces astaci]|uniref:Myb/SANT-like domain-containing protein n=1 Tax=Aphanomyces astaci TaxID=112090 RepID=A0A397ELG1_APHAT|nr:hypothetical protein DYB38_004383 [Aphanomyces astaci]RHY96063.1 hypothetical protein DYB31_015715 [Aphanomyces astaci]
MTIWNDELDAVWINEMIHQANVLGKRSNSGFKKEAWATALSKLNAVPDSAFTMLQLKSRNTTIKERFSLLWRMANASGMGWERSRALVVCVSTTWDAFLVGKSKDMARWKNKPFPLYDLCEVLYKGTPAKGTHAQSSTSMTTTVSVDDAEIEDVERGLPSDHSDDDGNNISTCDTASSKRPCPDSDSPPRRVRRSAASMMANELKAQSESISKELAMFATALQGNSDNSGSTDVEAALEILQDEFDSTLDENEMLKAIDVLATEVKAKVFMRLRGTLRAAWLHRQIVMD